MSAGSGSKRRTSTPINPNSQPPLRPSFLKLLSTITSQTATFLSSNDLNLLPCQTLTLESLLQSTSKSLHHLTPSPSHSPSPRPPIDCWFHRFLTSTSSSQNDPRWIDCFRMSQSSFTLLLTNLTPHLHSAFQTLPPNYILGAAIYRLAHAASYASVAKRFAMDSTEVCRAFFLVCKSVNECLGHYFNFQKNSAKNKSCHVHVMDLPNCCGVLGMERFGVDGSVFGAENGAVMVQAVVDGKGRFVDVSAGWPSSMDALTILKQTKLYEKVEDTSLLNEDADGEEEGKNRLLSGEFECLSDGMSVPQYFLGEACYPLLPWLMTPYFRINEEDSFSSKEKAFNDVHKEAMEIFRLAFARVRARWRLLGRKWKEESVEVLPFVIVTGCLLHNFLKVCGEDFPEVEREMRWAVEEPVLEGEESDSAQRIRDSLATHIADTHETQFTRRPEDIGNVAISEGARFDHLLMVMIGHQRVV